MKTIKRTLAVVLTLLMLIGVVPVGVMNVSAAGLSAPTISSFIYNSYTNKMIVSFKKVKGTKTQFNVADNSNFNGKVATVFSTDEDGTKEIATINGHKIELNKTYYVRIRAVQGNTTSAWSSVKSGSNPVAKSKLNSVVYDISGNRFLLAFEKPSSVYKAAKEVKIQVNAADNKKFTGTVSTLYFKTDASTTDCAKINGRQIVDGKTYYFRIRTAVVLNGVTYYSEWSDVLSGVANPKTEPTVTLRPVDHIETNAATVHLTARNPGKLLITARGVQVKKKGASSWAKTYSEDLSKKSYNKDTEITGYFDIGSGKEVNYALSAGTTYEYRCFVTSGGTNYYSNVSTFTTKPGLKPTWSKYNTSNITETNAKIEARVTFNQSVKHEKCGFYLGTQSGKLTKNAKDDTINKNRTYTDMWYDLNKWYGKLKPGTTYYYQFFIVANGTEYKSAEKSFKTKGTPVTEYNFTVKYNANGGTGTMADQTAKGGQVLTMTQNQFKRAGYDFVGWNVKRGSDSKWFVSGQGWKTESDISKNKWTKKVYGNGITFTFDSSWSSGAKPTDTFTFYAVWKECEHVWNDGIVTKEPTTKATGVKTFTCERCGKTKTEKIPKITAFAIKYVANGGKGTMAGTTVQTGDTFTLPECAFTKGGAFFSGWAVKRSSDSKWYTTNGTWETAKTITTNGLSKEVFDAGTEYELNEEWINGSKNTDTYSFYAIWIACEHEWDDGEVTKEPTTKATGVMTYTCELCGATKTEKIPKLTSYQIKYAANGGKGTMTGAKVLKDDAITLSECEFTRAGYTFNGWMVKRTSDSKWLTEEDGWKTDKVIKAEELTKTVFDSDTEISLDEDWINGTKNVDTYTFYAVWVKE